MNEKLLNAWIELSNAIRGERVVSSLTFNESVICNLLAKDLQEDGCGLTATDLCRETQMRKSQMNRTLNSLEERGLISRVRSESDHRKVLVSLNPGQARDFQEQHGHIMKVVDEIASELGEERVAEIVSALEDLSAAARKVLDGKPSVS